jgi:hypothetical protein
MRLGWVIALVVFCAHAQAEPPAFARLKTLVGEWEGDKFHVSFRLMSNDSVLVETYRSASGKETLTVFHPDGARVIATHYCAQGNQPRLKLVSSTGDRFVFEYLDATNLQPPAAYMRKLELSFDGASQYSEVETYDDGGKPDVTTLRFRRVR